MNDREKYTTGTTLFIPGKGFRTVKSAQFDDTGRCTEWTDTRGDKHVPWFTMKTE